MRIKSIKKTEPSHTWGISVEDGEEYILPNGVICHNTSAQIANATNGIEPIQDFVTIKGSKDGVLPQVAPELKKLKKHYEKRWDQPSPEGYLKIVAVMQKHIDQSISANTSYNPAFYPDEKIPMSELMKHIFMAYKYGVKTLYYNNTLDGQGEVNVDKMLSSNEKTIILDDDNDCDSCKI